MKKPKISDIKDLQDGIPSHVFLRHMPLILFSIFVALVYISSRFDCITAMETMAKLDRQLEITRTDVQRERAMYMSATCESSMQKMVDSLGLGLQIQERPPYKITLE